MGYRNGLQRLPDGRWRVRKIVGGKIRKATCSRKKLAEEFVAKLEREELRLPATKRRTIKQVATEYIDRITLYGRHPLTIRNHRVSLERLAKYFNLEDAADLTQDNVDGYVRFKRARRHGMGAVLIDLKHLRAWVRAAGVPLDWRIPDLKLEPHERYCPTDEELGRVFAALDPDLELPFLLAALSGMRPAEVFRAMWDDVQGRVLTIRAEKTGVRTPTWICDTLLAALGERGSGPLVTVTSDTLRGRLVRLSHKLGLGHEWSGLIYLRHWFSTAALDAGFSDGEVDAVLSHARRGILRRHYAHQSHAAIAERRRPLIEAVEAKFCACEGTDRVRSNVAKQPEVLPFAVSGKARNAL